MNDTFAPDIRDFISILNANRVEYVLVGGYALAAYGVVRATVDIDFFYRSTRANVRRLMKAMDDFGAPRMLINESSLLERESVTQLGHPPYRIDLLSTIDGVSFTEAWAGKSGVTIDDEPLAVIGLTELVANKAATGRLKDKADVRELNRKRKKR